MSLTLSQLILETSNKVIKTFYLLLKNIKNKIYRHLFFSLLQSKRFDSAEE